MSETTTKVLGTHSASKVLDLLKRVGFHHPQGVRLRDLISESGLDRSTTHRLLACLLDAGFVERAAPGKLYRLGMEAMQLGLLSASMVPVVERFHQASHRTRTRTGFSKLRLIGGSYVEFSSNSAGFHSEKIDYTTAEFALAVR